MLGELVHPRPPERWRPGARRVQGGVVFFRREKRGRSRAGASHPAGASDAPAIEKESAGSAAAEPPVLTYACSPAPTDCTGWYRTSVTVKWGWFTGDAVYYAGDCAPNPDPEPVGVRSPEPEREPASTPAGAPAPTARGWLDQASRWALLTVPVLRCGSRLAIDRDDRPAVPGRPDPAPPATGTEA